MKKFIKKNWLIIFAILYLLSPIDLFPDFIPVLGVSDDLVVLLATIVIKFLEYKNTQEKRKPPKAFGNTEILDGEIVE